MAIHFFADGQLDAMLRLRNELWQIVAMHVMQIMHHYATSPLFARLIQKIAEHHPGGAAIDGTVKSLSRSCARSEGRPNKAVGVPPTAISAKDAEAAQR